MCKRQTEANRRKVNYVKIKLRNNIMEIKVGKLAGFCYGVKNAVDKAEKIADEYDNVYCIGEIVHNEQVVKKLENKGIKFLENIEDVPNNSKVIFRAHGVPKSAYEIAKEKGLEIFDLTCPNVIKLHEKVEKMKKDYFIILVRKSRTS